MNFLIEILQTRTLYGCLNVWTERVEMKCNLGIDMSSNSKGKAGFIGLMVSVWENYPQLISETATWKSECSQL